MTDAPKYTLAIDTLTKKGGLSLFLGSEEIDRWDGGSETSLSAALLPQIDTILKASNLSLQEISLFTAAAGPGSFTGARIGLSTLKAFQLSLNASCLGVSMLRALALAVPGCEVLTGIPSGRTEMFCQKFVDGLGSGDIFVADITEIPALLGDEMKFVTTFDIKPDHEDLICTKKGREAVVTVPHPAEYIGRLGLSALIGRLPDGASSLEPIYVREAVVSR